MSLLKYIDRLKRMDDLIRRKATGNVEEFADKLGISRSLLLQEIKELRDMGAPIEYSTVNASYYYCKECRLQLDFTTEMEKIKGGKSFSVKTTPVQYGWTDAYYLTSAAFQ